MTTTALSPFELTNYEHAKRDGTLRSNFAQFAGEIALQDIATMTPNASHSLDQYSLLPMQGSYVRPNWSTMMPAAYGVAIPEDITIKWDKGRCGPYLDGNLALGLTCKYTPKGAEQEEEELIAVAAGGLSRSHEFTIKQLQGVPRRPDPNKPRRNLYRIGLNDIAWRPTLIRGMMHIATRAGATRVVMQGAANNKYIDSVTTIAHKAKYEGMDEDGLIAKQKTMAQRMLAGYDEVAESMGFAPTPERNWSLNLLEPPDALIAHQ
jgi:hypothetical protein